MSRPVDPRPLIGEPLPLDLMNTRWMGDDGPYDLLAMPGGLGIWLRSAGLAGVAPDTPETLDALLVTRAALHELAETGAEHAREQLNATLRHGRFRRRLGEDGPETVIETDTPGWRPAWEAAEHYLRLLETNPSRLRRCANPECVLRFYDVSKAGARRWCSMATCGNRSKYRAHHARAQSR
ncbi:CGNR zinc finger domain-containing protein [Actinoplanes philippinensis]|uniref:CGNR zinc finger domain-containing protein n=1 Tax=Actinoplanes philippinensis TaxID=35752 RepID=UPI0033D4B70A